MDKYWEISPSEVGGYSIYFNDSPVAWRKTIGEGCALIVEMANAREVRVKGYTIVLAKEKPVGSEVCSDEV